MPHERTAIWISATLGALAALAALGWWLSTPTVLQFAPSLPGRDDPQGQRARDLAVSKAQTTQIGNYFLAGDGTPSTVVTASWPGFRGPGLDNISTEATPLAETWPEAGPPVLWSLTLGEGHAAAAVHRGRLFIMDYLEEAGRDALRCFSMDDGREIWQRAYEIDVKRNHGMSRTIPAVCDDAVISIGPRGHVMACDPISGDLLWTRDLVREYGTEIPGWHAGQCPVIDDDRVILAPAGTNVLMIACALRTGRLLWKCPTPAPIKMSHASVAIATVDGHRMYVYAGVGGVVGVGATGGEAGHVLWLSTDWTPSVIAPSPVALDDGRIFLTAGYGAGSALLKVTSSDGDYKVETVYKKKPREGLACEQMTPLFYEGHLFGIMPKDGGALRNQLICYEPDGTIVWSSGKTVRFGIGPYILADAKFYIMDDDGALTMARYSLEGYTQLGHAKVLDGVDSWGPLALVNGRLLARDSTRMVCLDVSRDGITAAKKTP